ncbi:MAG TPA: SlyX family protein [Candidatus Ornithospirochaeta avicola]|uniref:SlyX family protein n=1 Tax=Candidatus Ornithospirochaeta avicola TaxID=2840896 RepID=A0A9D1PUR5_9SPIO|nr:SlyX family protein [Candidatus Ornithospirochaeta avicola]
MDNIEALEIKIAYLEKQNAELSELLIEADKDIAGLKKKLDALEKKVEDIIEEGGVDRPNRRPPHY